MKYEEVQSKILSSPRRCRRGFHLLDDEAAYFPISEDIEINHSEVTFDTFFKQISGPTIKETTGSKDKSHTFQVFRFCLVESNI